MKKRILEKLNFEHIALSFGFLCYFFVFWIFRQIFGKNPAEMLPCRNGLVFNSLCFMIITGILNALIGLFIKKRFIWIVGTLLGIFAAAILNFFLIEILLALTWR